MRKKIVLMLAAAASLTLIPSASASPGSTCAVADPTADAVICGVVFGTVYEACAEKPLYEICKRLN